MKNNSEELLNKINTILNEFENYNIAVIDRFGDITIEKKIKLNTKNKDNILTNVFKQMIAKDLKRNRI